MALELKFEATSIEVSESFQYNGSKNRLIAKDTVVNEKLVNGGRNVYTNSPMILANKRIALCFEILRHIKVLTCYWLHLKPYCTLIISRDSILL